MKVLLYTTNPEWKSWDKKLSACRGAIGLVKGTKEVQIDVRKLEEIPLEAGGKLNRAWYNKLTIFARSIGYQAVAVHMNVDFARDMNITKYRGCAINDETVGEIWIVADEKQIIRYSSGRKVNRFIKVFIHEMSHWMSDYLGVEDKTHHFDYNRENILLVLSAYEFKQGYMEKILSAFRKEVVQAPLADWKALTISQHFGVANKEYKSGIHAGTDFAVPVGTPIYAPTDGTLSLAWKNSKTLGNALFFEFFYNGRMYGMRCAHLQASPRKGTYRRGDVIGTTGNTGKSSGPHLHMEVWRGGYNYDVLLSKELVLQNLVNPRIFFDGIITKT